MNSKIKEKLCLDALGLKVGDKINVNYPKDMSSNFEIKESDNGYYIENRTLLIPSPDFIKKLIECDFMIIKHKKTKGELHCGDFENCTKCPFFALNCNGIVGNFYDELEDLKENMPCKAYEEYKKVLDEEIE